MFPFHLSSAPLSKEQRRSIALTAFDDSNGTRNHPGLRCSVEHHILCDGSTQAVVMEKVRHASEQGAHWYKLLL
jgi:hypothetical protein